MFALVVVVGAAAVLVRHLIDRRARKLIEESPPVRLPVMEPRWSARR